MGAVAAAAGLAGGAACAAGVSWRPGAACGGCWACAALRAGGVAAAAVGGGAAADGLAVVGRFAGAVVPRGLALPTGLVESEEDVDNLEVDA